MKRHILILIICFSVQLLWAKKIIVKMATLAPEGTEWHGLLVDLGQQWTEVTNGEVRLRIYPGGVVGDERDMIRKMRIGQIHGAAITNEGMTEINPYFTAFYMPMLYQTYEEVDFVRSRLSHELLSVTEKNGFKILTMVDVGWAYWFSSEPVYTPEDLKKTKIFIWAGDYKTAQLYEKHGYQPVPLAMTDVLSGLQTGLVNSLGFNPIYALSQQLFGIADNMLNMKWGNLTAAIVIDNRTWRRIKPEHQASMMEIAQKIGTGFQEKNRHESGKAIDVMVEYGLKVNTPTPEQVMEWKALIERMYPDFRGTLIDEVTFDRLMEVKNEMDSRKK
ncbi:MAG: TRAP transporter substrate-binding protein DctP [Candidatus Marinimicrobia bacterium]|nr:TRAP transporter substrate-binding protein DctP [Candidatus Neomarinimicrobiota bacterium]MBL7010048.1 TRAP transporter substrate-binding protein DctP [Candidatus Neomarinimicrobiota bacterium]MBL7030317.1 TRAP transporter substrate-binding protein DctP [Candidatus Neomarinimicrobiota bacterium]